ncbi:hypothetical protein L1N85_14395 [Paenibacillus alkaliterrae]|uniref:hypothetical protein n=1 Tax=Paenibacillus alkaliterrae TaxID=320909 RepID=UPI001F2111B1|nr:hypothetical protein [Paenibacillus alkaliterrae]MCF2939610.1 hypothetical protein [Paenibacillus alkaliterrae]
MNYCWNYRNVAGQMDMYDNRFKSFNHHKSNTCINENFVDSLVGKCVKINRGGPDKIEGKLLAVKSDYYVVKTKKGIVYVAASHVKSITETNGKQDCNKSGHKSGHKSDKKYCHKSDHKCCHKSGHHKHDFIKADNFKEVLRALNQTFVQINTGGPEKVEGFLAQVCKDSVLLVDGEDTLQIPIEQIKSIKSTNDKKSDGHKDCNKNYKTQGNRTGGSRTGGNRSGGKKSANAASVITTPKTTRRMINKV